MLGIKIKLSQPIDKKVARMMDRTNKSPKTDFKKELLGVYVLYKDDEVIYVGRSGKIYSRVCQHLNGLDFDYFRYQECSNKDIKALENYYIEKLRPKKNIIMNLGEQYLTQKEIEKFISDRAIKLFRECVQPDFITFGSTGLQRSFYKKSSIPRIELF